METQTTLNRKNSQDWHVYNLAKTNEKFMFYLLLDELCNIIPEPIHTVGRRPIPIRDLLFCGCLKLYSNYSARKISSDMKHAEAAGFIHHVPHFNSLLSFMGDNITEELLQRLITISAMPLKQLETDFAADSSGFGCQQYEKWIKARFCKTEHPQRLWKNFVKAHITVGTVTNVITAVRVTRGYSGDSPEFEYLANQTAKNFNVERFSADKAYSGHKNYRILQALDIMPFIPFKSNAVSSNGKVGIWDHMLTHFKENKKDFDRFYHRRSNVESTFNMIKTRLGEFLKCRNLQSQKNEVLLKCLVHNICCLVQEIFESKIKIDFNLCSENYVAHKQM